MNNQLVNKIVISASHNVLDSQEEADERILRKAQADMDLGCECVSYNFIRVADSPVDENKCLMPIYRQVPLVAHKIIQRVSQGLEVIVVGSDEVKLVVESLQDFLGVKEDRLRHVKEERSLAGNIAAGVRALHLGKREGLVFESGDTPCADELVDILTDKDIIQHILVADLNGRSTAFNGSAPFFARNYYWIVYNGKAYIACKEPNVWLFRQDFPFEKVNTFYQNRQGGKLDMLKLSSIIGRKFLFRAPFLSVTTGYDIARGITQKLVGTAKPWRFYASSIEDVSPAFFDGESVKFKVTHKDPFRIKDVDAWHDLWFYTHLVNKARDHKKGLSVLPYFAEVNAYSDFIDRQGLPGEIGMLRNFPRYANHRALQLNMKIAPFSADKTFQAPLEAGADIDAAMYHLEQRDAN